MSISGIANNYYANSILATNQNRTSNTETETATNNTSSDTVTLSQAGLEAMADSETNTPRPNKEVISNYYHDLVSDPQLASKHAKELAYGLDIGLPIPARIFEAAVAAGDFSKISNGYSSNDPNNPAIKISEERIALFHKLVGEGASSLEIIKKIHQFNIDLPLSYSHDFLDPANLYAPDKYRELHRDALADLQSAIDNFG